MADDAGSFEFDFPRGTLRGRLILLAGGSGGLGAACANLLAREGARLILGDHQNRERAEALAGYLRDTYHGEEVAVAADIADESGRQRLFQEVATCGNPLYGMVCLVGDPARVKWANARVADLAASFELNYTGPILLARDTVKSFQENSMPGAIVLFSTMQALALFPGSINYAGPKNALIQAARVMAKENAGPSGIRVNVVAPGVNRAGMALASIQSGKYDRFVEEGIIPRFGRAEDVARAVRLFLEPENYVTGQVLAVDGGFSLQV